MRKFQQDSWDKLANIYQRETFISCDDFHYGPLIPGEGELRLLPPELNNRKCLEIACGAAQNSIFLATSGAQCAALDMSERQLAHARRLAAKHGQEIKFIHSPMENIDAVDPGGFDLVHSVYGLPFAENPGDVVAACAKLLLPGGILLLSLPHPLYAGEFLHLDGDSGIFMENYFEIAPDIRYDEQGAIVGKSAYFTVEQISGWLFRNGLHIERILEPRPSANPPYTSPAWEEYREQFERFPGTVIFKAVKP